jgi:GTPase
MNFVDRVTINIESGSGGNGCCAFRREKYNPKGGPSGGDGGNGGTIYFVASTQISTLLDLRYKQSYKASRGRHGEGSDKFGKHGDDLYIKVPVGTMVYDVETGDVIGDLVEDEEKLMVAKGGHGGFGNLHFVTSTQQAPITCNPGEPGEKKKLRLELKLLADVGLLGFPNAGKSTLLASVTKAKPKIAGYPFTTLKPNLGVVQIDNERSFVMADIPGLVEGASTGKGLGDRFLKHIERTSILLHLVEYPLDSEFQNPVKEVELLEKEIESFNEKLKTLPRIVVMTKIDLCHDKEELVYWKKQFESYDFFPISGVTSEGLKPLLNKVWEIVSLSKT